MRESHRLLVLLATEPKEPGSFLLNTMQGYNVISLWALARIIQRDWEDIPSVVEPYVRVMLFRSEQECLAGPPSVVGYFLCNAHTWRGDTATAVKAELKRRLEKQS